MVSKSLAVLRYNWQQQASNASSVPAWTDAQFDAVFKGSGGDWSIAEYWRDATLGIFDLSGSRIFPWRTLNMTQPMPFGGERARVFAQGVQQALDDHIPLDQFAAVVVFVHPPPCDAGAVPNGALLDVGGDLSFYAEEIGHAIFTMDHSWGPVGEYGDPYCAMSAWTWGGTDPSYQHMAADPSLTPVYWSRAGPMVAGAMLAKYLPEFTNSSSAVQVDAGYAKSSRLVTLWALADAALGSAAVAIIPVAGQQFFVEYRRAHRWDQGLDQRVKPTSPGPAVVIHELASGHVTYRGKITMPPGSKRDWTNGADDLTVQIAGFDPANPRRVTVRIGGLSLFGRRRVTLDVSDPVTFEQVLLSSSSETFGVPEDLCPQGTYNYYRFSQRQQITCRASAFGFNNPQFSWSINGALIPQGSSRISVAASVTIPDPRKTSLQNRSVDLSCSLSGANLEISSTPNQGNYTLTVDVRVSEQSNPQQSADGYTWVGMETETLVFEQRYYDDLDACLDHLRRPGAHRLVRSPFTIFIDKGDPPPLWLDRGEREEIEKLRTTIAQLAAEDRELAEQLAEVGSRRFTLPRERLTG